MSHSDESYVVPNNNGHTLCARRASMPLSPSFIIAMLLPLSLLPIAVCTLHNSFTVHCTPTYHHYCYHCHHYYPRNQAISWQEVESRPFKDGSSRVLLHWRRGWRCSYLLHVCKRSWRVGGGRRPNGWAREALPCMPLDELEPWREQM